MDKVQVYTTVLLAVNFVLAITNHGKARTGNDSFFTAIIGTLIALPYLGRIFGAW